MLRALPAICLFSSGKFPHPVLSYLHVQMFRSSPGLPGQHAAPKRHHRGSKAGAQRCSAAAPAKESEYNMILIRTTLRNFFMYRHKIAPKDRFFVHEAPQKMAGLTEKPWNMRSLVCVQFFSWLSCTSDCLFSRRPRPGHHFFPGVLGKIRLTRHFGRKNRLPLVG
jgi:hypothetical protein